MDSSKLNSYVAEELRSQQARLQFTNKNVAHITGIPISTVRRYLKGEREIPIAAFATIARALRVTPESILRVAEERLESEGIKEQTTLALPDLDGYDLSNPDPKWGLAALKQDEHTQNALEQYNQHAE